MSRVYEGKYKTDSNKKKINFRVKINEMRNGSDNSR